MGLAESDADEELPPSRWSTRYCLLMISAFAQLISLWITWPLWNQRTEIPNLPVFDLGIPQLPFGWLLVLTLAVVPFRPRLGVWLHFALMLIACLFDQMRLQPQFLATWILMLATLGQSRKNDVRWFLSSLWIWAGLHKAISPDWNSYRAHDMAAALGLDADDWFGTVAVVVAATELLVGLIAWWRPRWGATGCVMLHVGIALYLSPLFLNWNDSVLPWNLATAVVGSWILWTCDPQPTIRQRFMFGTFMILPLGFFVGWLDHGYSHVLYSGSIPQGLITHNDGTIETIAGWGEVAVPFPNERRTLRQRFDLVAQPGDRLHILDPRPALDDLHYLKQAEGVRRIDREEFFAANAESVVGVELDSSRHLFWLSQAGARMLRRSEDSMVYAIEFKPEHFRADQLYHLQYLPNLEQIQLSQTDVTDRDLKLLIFLPKLQAIGLNQTAITDHGIEILSMSRSLKLILVNETEVSDEAIEQFLDSR